MSKVSVHIVTWNSRKVLADALESLHAQTFRDFSVIVVDNASSDGTVDVVREHYPQATVLRNFKNLGFARGHNQAIEMSRLKKPHYILVMNPDVILTPDFLGDLLDGVMGRPEVGSAGGKLLRVRSAREIGGDPDFTDTIDSLGLVVKPSRRTADRGAGETDRGQYKNAFEVFGVSGALALYRMEAVDAAIEAGGEFFDEDMFAYKEDVDVAWRLRLLGWKALCAPMAKAYHYRGTGSDEENGPIKAFKGRWRRPVSVSRYSTRNHLLMLAKNETFATFYHWPLIALYEIAKFFATLVFFPRVVTAYVGYLKLLPAALKKRRRILARKNVRTLEIRKWFV